MPSQIVASHRNKDYISQVVNAFMERDIPGFAQLFSQHDNPATYKQIKTRKTPSDYALLSELMNNLQDDFGKEDALTILLSIGQEEGLSELARLGVYFATFAHVSEQDRASVFGMGAPLHLAQQDLQAINTYFNSYDEAEYYTGRHDIKKFYRQSIVKDQSAEDFLLNIELAAKLGINFLDEMSRLRYEDKPGGPSTHEQYAEILNPLDKTAAYNMVRFMTPSTLTYEMVKKHGLFYIHPIEEFTSTFLPQAFERDDIELFKQIFQDNIFNQHHEQVERILNLMTPLANMGNQTDLQKKMYALVVETHEANEQIKKACAKLENPFAKHFKDDDSQMGL